MMSTGRLRNDEIKMKMKMLCKVSTDVAKGFEDVPSDGFLLLIGSFHHLKLHFNMW